MKRDINVSERQKLTEMSVLATIIDVTILRYYLILKVQ